MENRPRRSLWEQSRMWISSFFAANAADPPLETTPETQELAARITGILAMSRNPQAMTPDQQAQWESIKQPFLLMYKYYDVPALYRHWQQNPDDADARRAFQSYLLGVLTIDAELRYRFNAALPPPVPEWLPQEEELPATEPIPPAEPTPAIDPDQPPEAVQPEAAQPAQPAEPALRVETPPAREDAALPGINELITELLSGGELYHILYAMHYANPDLLSLASKLADEPKLSRELYEFLNNTKRGKQLTNK